MNGSKLTRWSRVVNPQTGRGLIIPIDHGLTSGAMDGLRHSAMPARWLNHPAITAVVAHKGMVARLNETGCLLGKGVILQLNGMISSAAQPHRKEMLASIDAALRMGADAVSLDLVFDGEQDSHNLRVLGAVADEASAYGLPILVMVKCLGAQAAGDAAIPRLRRVVRSIWELGADAVKLQKPEAISDIPLLLDGLAADIDVFFAGGPRSSDEEIARLLTLGLNAGAKGLCVGRNVFQNAHPEKFLTALGLRAARQPDANLALVNAG